MTLVEGEELQRLWTLVSELSSQLSANQQLCQSLQQQADELKGHALHSGTGYTLRRFNLDISKEKFESELEKINAQIVVDNQTLAHENKQMNLLLREYESALEQVMSKFRSFSHATQQHTLGLTQHYETLLANNSYEVANADLSANTAFTEHLAHLGSLVRLALREVEGEAIDEDAAEEQQPPFEAEGYRVGSPSGAGPSKQGQSILDQDSMSNSIISQRSRKSKQPYGSAVRRDPRWHGTGGYTGFQGDPDAEVSLHALEAQTEEERLRAENETLRQLLRISADLSPEVAQSFGISVPPAVSADAWSGSLVANKLSLGKPRGSRKSLGEASNADNATQSNEQAIAAENNASGIQPFETSNKDNAAVGEIDDDDDAFSNAIASEQAERERMNRMTRFNTNPFSRRALAPDDKTVLGGISHAAQGAGAAPQLVEERRAGHTGERGSTDFAGGVTVQSADIADELSAQRRDQDIQQRPEEQQQELLKEAAAIPVPEELVAPAVGKDTAQQLGLEGMTPDAAASKEPVSEMTAAAAASDDAENGLAQKTIDLSSTEAPVTSAP